MDYFDTEGSTSGDAGDQYSGLDRFGRVIDQKWTKSSTVVDELQYSYDADSNVLSETNTVDTADSETFTYDSLNRLTNYTRGSGGGATSGSWSLDAEGNWISSTVNGTTTDRTNNAQNQVTQVGGNTLTYDADGNLTTDQNGNTYVYDAWGRLTSVTTGSDTISYTYDALGRRISQTDGNTGVITDLIYSGQQVIQENQSGTPVAQYV